MEQRTDALEAEIRALDEGRAFVDRSGFRKISVSGADASAWLNDLVTAAVERLATGDAARSLLLTPTGRIRADLHVIRTAEGFLLLQDSSQPRGVGDLLEPYVLSSDVSLRDRSGDLAVFSVPGADVEVAEAVSSHPSLLGEGTDLAIPADRRSASSEALIAHGLTPAGEEAVDAWRVRRGVPRFPVDVDQDSLPAEAGLERFVDFAKGCFLGQESVAKVRNFGHPPRVLLALRAAEPVAAGEAVLAGGREAGEVTSAAPAPGGTAVLARVRWEARSEKLATAAGVALRPA